MTSHEKFRAHEVELTECWVLFVNGVSEKVSSEVNEWEWDKKQWKEFLNSMETEESDEK